MNIIVLTGKEKKLPKEKGYFVLLIDPTWTIFEFEQRMNKMVEIAKNKKQESVFDVHTIAEIAIRENAKKIFVSNEKIKTELEPYANCEIVLY